MIVLLYCNSAVFLYAQKNHPCIAVLKGRLSGKFFSLQNAWVDVLIYKNKLVIFFLI